MPDIALPNMEETLGKAFDAAQLGEAVDASAPADTGAVTDDPAPDLGADPISDDGGDSVEEPSPDPGEASESPDAAAAEAADPAPDVSAGDPEPDPAPAASEFETFLETRRASAEMQGMTPLQEVKMLYQLSDHAANDPAGFIKAFAQQRGIDLASLVSGGDTPEPGGDELEINEYTDPGVKALVAKVQALEHTLQTHSQAQENAAAAQAQAQVDRFANATGEGGAKLHPHFEAVKGQIGALLRAGVAETLEAAYEQACWSNPTVRAQLQQEADNKRAAEAKVKAKAAERAANQPRGEGGQFTSTKARTMNETLGAIYDRLQTA